MRDTIKVFFTFNNGFSKLVYHIGSIAIDKFNKSLYTMYNKYIHILTKDLVNTLYTQTHIVISQ